MSMFDVLAGPVVEGSFGIGAGALSNMYQQSMLRQQQNFQRELAQNSIKYRVEDAQRSGIHPLYALGAPTMSSFPMQLDDHVGPALANMGQSVGNAVTRMLDAPAREKDQLELRLLQKQMDESDARSDLLRSQAALNRQAPGAPMPGLGIQREGSVSGSAEILPDGQNPDVRGQGYIDVKPVDQFSTKEADDSVKAGVHPGHEERNYQGMPMLVPETAGESLEEIISEMSPGAFLGLLNLNANKYGGHWLQDFLRLRYLGQKPTGYYMPLEERRRMGVKPYPRQPLVKRKSPDEIRDFFQK